MRTDADVEAWRALHAAVLPDEPVATADELAARVERGLWLAEADGSTVGAGFADRSGLVGHGVVWAGVELAARRRGIGRMLLRECVDHAAKLGLDAVVAHVDGRDDGSRAFAERMGFAEADRQLEQVVAVAPVKATPLPDGLERSSIAERPDLLEAAYDLAVEAFADMVHHSPATTTLEEWLREEATLPGGSFVALAGEEIVGYSGLIATADEVVAEDGLTAVRRAWRRRGVARALKEAELAWAASNGIREVFTWTQRGNDGMRRLNEELGYAYRHVSVTMTASRATVEARLA